MRDKFLKLLPLCFAGTIIGAMFVAGIGAAEPKTAVTFNSITHQSTEYCDFIGSGIKFNGQLPVVQTQLQSYQVNLGYTPASVAQMYAVNSQLASYQVNLGYTAENAANKSNDVVADYNSSTKYSTTGSIWTWVKSLLSINEISSVGSGASLYSDRLGDTVRLKSLVQGANIAINSYSDHIEIAGTASSYTLPIAAAGTLGGVKVGSGLSIDGSGVLSASGGTLPVAALGTSGTQTINRNTSDKFTLTPASAVTLATSNFTDMQEAFVEITNGGVLVSFPAAWEWQTIDRYPPVLQALGVDYITLTAVTDSGAIKYLASHKYEGIIETGLLSRWTFNNTIGDAVPYKQKGYTSTGVRDIRTNSGLACGTIAGRTGLYVPEERVSAWSDAPATGLPTGASSRTLMCWYYAATGLDNGQGHGLFGQNGSTGRGFLIRGWATLINCDLNGSGVLSYTSVAPNTWTHYALVYDGTILTAYKNGVYDRQVTITLNTESSSVLFNNIFGQSNYKAPWYMSDCRIYDRALSAAEIDLIANHGR